MFESGLFSTNIGLGGLFHQSHWHGEGEDREQYEDFFGSAYRLRQLLPKDELIEEIRGVSSRWLARALEAAAPLPRREDARARLHAGGDRRAVPRGGDRPHRARRARKPRLRAPAAAAWPSNRMGSFEVEQYSKSWCGAGARSSPAGGGARARILRASLRGHACRAAALGARRARLLPHRDRRGEAGGDPRGHRHRHPRHRQRPLPGAPGRCAGGSGTSASGRDGCSTAWRARCSWSWATRPTGCGGAAARRAWSPASSPAAPPDVRPLLILSTRFL